MRSELEVEVAGWAVASVRLARWHHGMEGTSGFKGCGRGNPRWLRILVCFSCRSKLGKVRTCKNDRARMAVVPASSQQHQFSV